MAFKIGIVGVGRMGSNMALRLKVAGIKSRLFDSQSKLAEKWHPQSNNGLQASGWGDPVGTMDRDGGHR